MLRYLAGSILNLGGHSVILAYMGLFTTKRRSARTVSCLIAAVAAMQGALVCQAACRQAEMSSHGTIDFLEGSSTPACHNQQDNHQRDSASQPDSSLCLGTSPAPGCCCQISQSAEFPDDLGHSFTVRPSTGTHTVAAVLAKAPANPATELQCTTRLHSDLSPPRTPRFISFHSLLI